MGKKGSWIAAIKRAFTPNSKGKSGNEFEKRKKKEKKKGVGKQRHGESNNNKNNDNNNNSFIPLFREPSSVEKIFLDFEREQQRVTFRPSLSPSTPPFVTPTNALSPRISSARRPSSPASSPRVVNRPKGFRFRPEPTLQNHHASATKIQAAYRGYVERRRFRELKGLMRLEGVMKGKNVKRQTMNAMKQMQLLVRVQSQIQSRRIHQMLDTTTQQPPHQYYGPNLNNSAPLPATSKWTFTSTQHAEQVAGCNQGDWDDSLLTREEIEARFQRKAEAIMKRERAMAYAYSHQLWKASPNSAEAVMADIRAAGFPWWWNWLERQSPSPNTPSEPQPLKKFLLTPQTPINKQHHMDQPTLTPKSTILPASKPSRNSPPAFRTPPASSRSFSRPFQPFKDDDSLTSCPPFSVPHYMAPTVSAKARLRPAACNTTPSPISTQSKTNNISFPFKWNKPNNLFSNSNKDSTNLDKNQLSLQSLGNLSVDSSVSLPAGVGRKPFNRFV